MCTSDAGHGVQNGGMRLSQLRGGEITVDSEPDRGSCFRVYFPESPAAL